MRIGVTRETRDGETRVSATPATVRQLLGLGYEVVVETGAGARSSFTDEAYVEAGASDRRRLGGRRRLQGQSARASDEIGLLPDGCHPDRPAQPGAQSRSWSTALAARPITALAMDAVPRISRAQSHGRAQLDGEHRRLPGRDRGRARVRAVLHRPGHRRRQGAAGQGARGRRRRRRAGRDRRGQQPRRDRAGHRPAAGGGRPGQVARRRVPPRRRRAGGQHRRLRQGDLGGVRPAGGRDLRRAGRRRRHHHHDRADPGPAGAEADHRRGRGEHEAGQRDRRHGRRSRAATSPARRPARSSPPPTA